MPREDEIDRKLREQADALRDFANNLVEWAAAHNPPRREQHLLPLEDAQEFQLLRLRQRAAHLERSSHLPAAVAVYGPSQVGKSLFIGRVLQPCEKDYSPFGLHGPGTPPAYYPSLSFTEDMNPRGANVEATALVTRFTTKERLGKEHLGFEIPAEHPVFVRALSRADWLKVLGRGTLAVGGGYGSTTWTDEKLRALFDELPPTGRGHDRDWQLDLFDAYDYLHSHDNRQFAPRPEVFYRLLVSKQFGPAEFARIAERLFWEPYPELTDLFDKVCDLLQKIRKHGRDGMLTDWAGVRVLLDTQRSPRQETRTFGTLHLGEFRERSESGWHVLAYKKDDTGGISQKDLALLQAALVEMVIPVLPERLTDKWRDVLTAMDLLDVPGMRAEQGSGTEGRQRSAATLDQQLEIVKRGKVFFLFDHYTEELQIQSLLLLARLGNTEVKGTLQRGLDRWGRTRFGDAWPQRLSGNPALFIGLTGIDRGFQDYASPTPGLFDDPLRELVQTLGATMTNFGGKGQPFTEVYPLRYPGTMDGDAARRQALGPKKWEEAGQIFLHASPLVQRHVSQPQERWAAAMQDDDGGLSLLSAAFLAGTDKKAKQDQLRRHLDETRQLLIELARPLVAQGEVNVRREQRLRLAGQVLGWLDEDRDLVSYYRVHALLSVLPFPEDDVHEVADLAETSARSAQGPVRTETLEQRLRQHLRELLTRWAGAVPGRWRAYAQRHPHHPFGADAIDIAALAHALREFLLAEEVFAPLVKQLLPTLELRIGDEYAARKARRKYTHLILNDYVTNPGPDAARLELAVEPKGTRHGLMLPFLQRWHQRLNGVLVLGAGQHVQIPPGNAELHGLLEAYTSTGAAR